MVQVHATCVALDGSAVLLWGPSGSGKSDLALRLIDAGAALVADDYTEVLARDGRLFATAPQPIAGMLEVRGVGVVTLAVTAEAPVALVVSLVAPEKVDRLPEPAHAEWEGIQVPLVHLAPFEASTPAKVRLAVRVANGDIRTP